MTTFRGPGRGLLGVGDTLAASSFPRLGAPGVVSWHQGTTATVVFAPHPGGCVGCSAYVAELEHAVVGLRDWATRVLVLVADPDAARDDPALSSAAAAGVVVVADVDGAGRRHLGAGDEHAVVVQTDRYGAVFEAEAVASPDARHATLPGPAALVALAKYIDIQCPECSIPSKEWLSVTPFPLG